MNRAGRREKTRRKSGTEASIEDCVKMDREYMAKVNSYGQKNNYTVAYELVAKRGPPHDPEFTVVVIVKGEEYGSGTGKSMKAAKEAAAKKAWKKIEEEEKSSSNMAAADLTTAQTTSTTSSPAPDKNYVCLLNSISQRTGYTVGYTTQNCIGDPHAPTYSVSCTIRGQLYGKGTGPSKAAAKKAAAKEAYEKWELERANNSNSSQVSAESDSDKNTVRFADSSAKLEEKMKDMAVCEKPSPSQRNAQRYVSETKRKLAANFAIVRNKEEEKNMSDSSEGLPDVDTNTGKENGSPCTVNKTFLELFEKIQHIGAGGFGNVFKATSKCDKTTYAIKRVEYTEKVEREARGLARLSHENIVRYHCSWRGYDRIKGSGPRQNSDQEICCLFIQMEFCEQGTLEDWVIKNSEDRKYHEMAQNKFLQIAKGVQCIHSEELIHRDLKPQNIFISHDNKIKIGDFGLVTSVAFETLTENRGTRSYMAPEQIGTKYGREVDIYALGLIWFEILSAITAHEKSKVWSSAREGELPEYFKNQFPAEASIIKKMLSRDPSGRITISHLLDLLNSVDKEKALRNYSY
ncbi:interferon-induced, double-stranded RNA-activated protein kinase isoform X2 [Zonotrichia leucophrys gambelii]|uniref:interferon-induced, double-stranded RNA-activated protein kinase isoform X2 n=1 Tax=Zonotrichia leucophrys gambelii TaxID=257770 RepID=UPI0031404B7C